VNVKNTTANGIHETLIAATTARLDIRKEELSKQLIGFTTDGAATFQACHSGVVSLLKSENPFLIGMHCIAHRVELAIRNTMVSVPKIADIEDTLLMLYTFYHQSPKRRQELRLIIHSKQFKKKNTYTS